MKQLIQAIAIDDEPLALKVISSFCKKSEEVALLHTFTQPNEALQYLAENPQIALVFLDIQMPGMSGMELKRKLPASVMVVFTTAFSEYAVEGFDVEALDYLLKPFTYDRFVQAIEKAKAKQPLSQPTTLDSPEHLLIRADYSLHKIEFKDILYIESIGDYLKIYIQNHKTIVARLTMKSMIAKLPENFVRINRSFIVPWDKIEAVRNKHVNFGGKNIRLGGNFEKPFMTKYLTMLK